MSRAIIQIYVEVFSLTILRDFDCKRVFFFILSLVYLPANSVCPWREKRASEYLMIQVHGNLVLNPEAV